jgi:transposase
VEGRNRDRRKHLNNESSHLELEVDAQKKTLAACERKEEERHHWREQAKELDVNKLRFIDETGSNIALTRLYARAPKGQRARGSIIRNRGKNVTLITDLTLRGFGEALIVDGSVNGELFEAYVERVLVPSLSAGEIVILDNCSIHTGEKVRQLVEAKGCQLLPLPTYSPDLTPIEEAFSKVKAILRRMGPFTRETLHQALQYALSQVSASDASGWFRHCGYSVPPSPKQEAA